MTNTLRKIVVIGDIHGRDCWNQIIDNNTDTDLFVFLGDYVSTHDNITQDQQIDNLLDILLYKEEHPDKVILLRGNHDLQHLGYYWAECSGYFREVGRELSKEEVRERYLRDTQWVFTYKNIVFSHAGISQRWANDFNIKTPDEINDMEPSEAFGFRPCKFSDYYGISETQGPVWIRPWTLMSCAMEGYTYVVGHTTVPHVQELKDFLSSQGEEFEELIKEAKADIWLCDTLPHEYLVIENDKFIPTKLC